MKNPRNTRSFLTSISAAALLATVAQAQGDLATAALPATAGVGAADELRLLPSAAAQDQAKRFQYRYVEAQLMFGDLDLNLAVEASMDLMEGSRPTDGVFGIAHLYYATDEEGAADIDWLGLSAGGGYHYRVHDQVDLLASAELEYLSAEASGTVSDGEGGTIDFSDKESEVGIRLHGGARFWLNEEIELRAGVTHHTAVDAWTQVEFAGQYSFTPQLAIVGQIEFGENTLFGIGGRFSF